MTAGDIKESLKEGCLFWDGFKYIVSCKVDIKLGVDGRVPNLD